MFLKTFQLIQCDIFEDNRGKVVFANDFDMNPIRRLYHIHHLDTDVVRAWQGHKVESKWFHCIKGGFDTKLVSIDDWQAPSKDLEIKSVQLCADNSQVLFIPGGYASGFKAITPNSILMVFSDMDVPSSKADDYRFDKGYFGKIW